MTDVKIRKTDSLRGKVCAPPSKSYTQRMVIASTLSNGTSRVSNGLISEDTEATLRSVQALGANIVFAENCWKITGANPLRGTKKPIYIGESGATSRFIVPLAALPPEPSVFILGSSLAERPIKPLLEALNQLGAEAEVQTVDGEPAIHVAGGGIQGGKATLPGDVSSQFVSGLMFACPLAKTDTELNLTTTLESKNYVRMTEDVLAKHGVKVEISEDFRSIKIPSGQTYIPTNHCVPGDFSSAAFLLAAAALTKSEVTIANLDYTTKQGDKQILGLLKKLGVNGTVCPSEITIQGSEEPLNSVNVDAREIPDLVPACAALACFAVGTSIIHHAERLRLKESDRLTSLFLELQKMGADINLSKNTLILKGPASLHGATVDPHNDHRIAMACSVAALRAKGETVIQNAECVRKSYPQFFNDLRKIGADVVGGQFDR